LGSELTAIRGFGWFLDGEMAAVIRQALVPDT
jgi:hypothetical protein